MPYPYLDPVPPETGRLDRWRQFLGSPDTRAALLQFGINMMQPIPVGQTFLGQLGQSVGAAGEAVGRREAERSADEERRLSRGIALSKLGLEGQELGLRQEAAGENVRQFDVSTGLKERELDIAANKAAQGNRASAAVFGQLNQARRQLLTEHQKMQADFDIGLSETPPPPFEQFVAEKLAAQGWTPEMIAGAEAAALPGDVVAGPRAPTVPGPVEPAPVSAPAPAPTASSPLAAPEQQTSFQGWIATPEGQQMWAEINRRLTSTVPGEKVKGLLAIDRLKKYFPNDMPPVQ